MPKMVWLYTEKAKKMDIYYCVDDGWYYWKNRDTPDTSVAVGVSLIFTAIVRDLGELSFHASTWYAIFIAVNLLLFIFMRAVRKDDEKNYHKYYPDRNQFIDHMAAIRKTYLAQTVSTAIFLVLIIIGTFCWIKSSEKMMWMALEIFCAIILYINIAINGVIHKKKVMGQIMKGEI